ncbi:uncharacterized protein F4807DRAFT_462474 [Annulohypoxylon truncatum]|uniref:uncharacterized protein n=1 Tax=Annulohypoxylon truncatum TaxID=327061 RepID=UPI00200749E6|nr:uncharacterized protein F4807DRAFT_462474 [Annulohypoxylon truncatum]KAI1207671.1 hypothetical protein F4807DRAFT_462474 [Annulohypoxylon truncatum]
MSSSQPSQTSPSRDQADDARRQIISTIIPCMILAFAALAMRLSSRRIKHSRLLVSDYFAIGGLVFSWLGALLMIACVPFGLGLHIESVPLGDVRQILLNVFFGEMAYGISFTLVKLSIITLYRQLFPTRFMLASTMVLAVVVIMWGIAVVLVSIFSCNPIRGFWDSVLPDYNVPTKCIDSKWFYIGISISNILTDAILLCLPMRDVWRLRLPWHSKLTISGVFALGAFVVAASSMRIYFMLNLDFEDFSFSFVHGMIWSAVEMLSAVVCCCLPSIRPVLAWLAHRSIRRRFSSDSTPVMNTHHRYKLQARHDQDDFGSQSTVLDLETGFSPSQTSRPEDRLLVAN